MASNNHAPRDLADLSLRLPCAGSRRRPDRSCASAGGGVRMDVIEFFSELRRMCRSSSDCTKCEYHGDKCDNAIELFEKTVAVVEQWSREHPRKTRQSKFLNMFPTARVGDVGVLDLCPAIVDDRYRGRNCGDRTRLLCPDCRREFWMQEVE